LRVVLDPNVLVSALIKPGGAPAELILRWLEGEFELVVSDQLLLGELTRVLAYPRLRRRVAADDAAAFVELLRESAERAADPAEPPPRSRDPNDDYLLALAEAADAQLVSGDGDLLALAEQYPIMAPRAFLGTLATAEE
jgi:uncharacterized protein